MKKIKFPRIGQRIIKSGAAVMLCFLVYQLSPRKGILFYMALAALQCMQQDHASTRSMARQRISGTLIGAIYGLITILLQQYLLLPLELPYLCYCLLLTLCVMACLYTAVILKFKSAAYFSCVVYLSVTMVHIGDENPYLFVLNRVVDTLIGVAIGMFVNHFHLPCRKNKDTLFVAGLDDVLLSRDSQMSAFSRVELNRMLEDGIPFSIMTMRTPASFLEATGGIRLKFPVILMDGAAIYNVRENTYPYKCEMPYEQAVIIVEKLKAMGLESFQNVINNDNVFIYFERITNEGSQDIYDRLRRSPYRNYINQPLPQGEPVVYIMVMDRSDKVHAAYESLKNQGDTEKYKILCYESTDYPGYAYLKIYHPDANKLTALQHLKDLTGFQNVHTFGTIPGMYDELVTDINADDVVRLLKKKYEPTIWRHRTL